MADGNVLIVNSIIWHNEGDTFGVMSGTCPEALFCNIEGGEEAGHLDADPLFTLPGYWDQNGTPDTTNDDIWVEGDYHLCSSQGCYSLLDAAWLIDDVDSPCLDAGDPLSSWNAESWPHGSRINLGIYGGTGQASKSRSRIGESVLRLGL